MKPNDTFLLGIDIGGTKTSVCVGTKQGRILLSGRMLSGGRATLADFKADLARLCDSIIKKAGVSRESICAAGISAPGPLDTARGVLIAPPNNPGWRDVPIVAMAREILGIPIHFNNDANACALAEYLFGSYKGITNLVYLTFSTGMGGGIIANGQLLQGVTDTAGEVGHHVIDANGPLCGCGMRGCWEAFVGGRCMAKRIADKIRKGNIRTSIVEKAGGDLDAISIEILAAAVKEGDTFALAEWDEFAERLAQGIGNLIMILNPQAVLLGTIAVHVGALIMDPIKSKLPKYAWSWPLAACVVVPSTLGAAIGDLSALAVAVHGVKTSLQPS